MDLKTCINVLSEHNKWRRGQPPYDTIPSIDIPSHPQEIGEAIDYAIEELKKYDLPVFIDENEYAAMVGKQVATIRSERNREKSGPPYYKIGAHVKYSIQDIMKYLEDCRVDFNKKES